MTIVKFLKISGLILLALWLINALGIGFFYFKTRSGDIQLKSAENMQTWTLWASPPPKTEKNDIGLREKMSFRELELDRRPKIVLLGNSVVFGAHVAEDLIFAEILQQQLPKYKIINAGLDGFEIWREFDFYQKHFLKQNVDMVIWFSGISDFISQKFVKEKVAESQAQNDWINPDLKTFFEPTFYKLLAQKVYVEYSLIANNFLSSPHNLYYTQGMMQAQDPALMDELSAEIAAFKKSLPPQTQMAAMFLPSRIYAQFYGWDKATAYHHMVLKLNEQKIPAFQAVDFIHENCPVQCYLDYVHLNARGHQLVGEAMAKWLIPLLNKSGSQ